MLLNRSEEKNENMKIKKDFMRKGEISFKPKSSNVFFNEMPFDSNEDFINSLLSLIDFTIVK
jgi:hypothetical protein